MDEKSLGQLASIRYFHDARGRVMVESKKDAVKRGVKSPDRAESLMLSFAAVGQQGGVFASSLTSVDDNAGVIYDAARFPGGCPSFKIRAIVCANGITVPTAFLEVCFDGKISWVVREFYYDNSRESVPLTEPEFIQHLIDFRSGIDPLTRAQHMRNGGGDVWLPDTDEAFRNACWVKGLPVTMIATDSEELVADVQRLSNLLGRKLLRISNTCVNTIEQLRAYKFDVRKAAQKGRDEPVEDGRSQCCSALRGFCKQLDIWRLI